MRRERAAGPVQWLAMAVVLLGACSSPTSPAAPRSAGAPPPDTAGGSAAAAPTSAAVAERPPSSPATPARLERMRVAYVAPSGGYLPLWIGQDVGFFRQHGLDVDIQFMSGVQAVQALLARELDLAPTDGAALVRAGLSGGEVVLIGASPNTVTFGLIANPTLHRPEDLRGRRLGISGAGNSTDFVARYLLRTLGYTPNVDVTLVQTGGSPQALEALTIDAIDAAIMSEPTMFAAINQGFPRLMDLGAVGLEYPLIGLGTLRSTLQERPGALRAFVAGYVDATAWQASHRAETLQILARYTKQDDPTVLGLTYDLYIPDYFPRAPYPTVGGIRTILDAIRDSDPRAADARPEDFVDDRFVRELDESGYIERLYR